MSADEREAIAKMMLSDEEKELLIITMEECGELVQACSKMLRFGKEEKHCFNLKEEIGDVFCMIHLLAQHGYISHEEILMLASKKQTKLSIYSNLGVV